MKTAVQILFEDNHLLVVNKPTGLATMGTGDSHSVHGWACGYIRRRYDKPGKVFLGVVHRLDAMSSGALVLARTSKAAARLSDQFRKSATGPKKIYLAVVAGHLAPTQGTLRDWLRKDEAQHCVRVVRRDGATVGKQPLDPWAVEAVLDYVVLRHGGTERANSARDRYSLVAVRLQTGRKHQIRVQFASRGYVIWGDAKYGDRQHRFSSGSNISSGIALHAASLTIEHPVGRQRITFVCQPPAMWAKFLPTAAEWQAALAAWDAS